MKGGTGRHFETMRATRSGFRHCSDKETNRDNSLQRGHEASYACNSGLECKIVQSD